MTIYDRIKSGEATVAELKTLPPRQLHKVLDAMRASIPQDAPTDAPHEPPVRSQAAKQPVERQEKAALVRGEWHPSESEKNPQKGPARQDGGYVRGDRWGWNKKGSINT